MRIRSLSATGALTYESCPKRYQVERFERAPQKPGSAASLGSACHEVAQRWVERGFYLMDPIPRDEIQPLWNASYWKLFSDSSRYSEGLELINKWIESQDWRGRTVLSTETMQWFFLETSIGPIPFNYILDRIDLLDNGDIEVIDYKTIMRPLQPQQLHDMIQSKCYALAAYLAHPTAKRIWVTFDLFRYDTVGTVFTAEECQDTLAYLHALAERMIADDNPEEIINDDCRWCMRSMECETLANYINAAGTLLASGSPEEIAQHRFRLNNAAKTIDNQIKEMDRVLIEHLCRQEQETLVLGDLEVMVTRSRRREVDTQALATILDPATLASLSNIGPSSIDALLKDGNLDPLTATRIRQTIRWKTGEQTIKVKKA